MNVRYLKKALLLFQAFRSYKLTTEDIGQAEQKAFHLGGQANTFRLLTDMAKDSISGKYKMNTWNKSVIVATIVYVISPLDAVPDIIPILGWLDDITIVGYALSKLSEEVKRYKSFVQSQAV